MKPLSRNLVFWAFPSPGFPSQVAWELLITLNPCPKQLDYDRRQVQCTNWSQHPDPWSCFTLVKFHTSNSKLQTPSCMAAVLLLCNTKCITHMLYYIADTKCFKSYLDVASHPDKWCWHHAACCMQPFVLGAPISRNTPCSLNPPQLCIPVSLQSISLNHTF